MNKKNPKAHLLPLRKALFYIILSTLGVSGISSLLLLSYMRFKANHRLDPAFNIVAIVQTSPHAEGIKSNYFAELFDLSIDRPTNLYSFNIPQALDKLKQLSVIKEAKIRKIRPGTIHVDYTMRKPIAILGDFSNIALDMEKTPFPIKPFYTPKRLPKIFLGVETQNLKLGSPLHGPEVTLAYSLLDTLNAHYSNADSSVTLIDVSKAFSTSYGQKQIVVEFEDRIEKVVDGQPVLYILPRLLRLNPENYLEQLANYRSLRTYLNEHQPRSAFQGKSFIKEKAYVIDLRISDLAFIAQ